MKVKWGVIGAGGIALRRTIPETLQIADNAAFAAVMDIDLERAEAVASRFNIPYSTDSEADLLSRDIDAVYIATPQNLHCRQVIDAARAGKHILCEKPLAISEEEIDRMEEACRKAGVKLMVGFSMRNNVYNRKARELVQSAALGQVVMARAQLTCWYPPIPGAWRQDAAISHGGCLIDMGTHCLDLMEWIIGTRIAEVAAFQDLMTHAYPTRIEDASTVIVRFANGAHGIADNYFNLPDAAAQNTLEIHGTKGSVIGQRTIGQDPSGRMFSVIQPQETGYNADQVRNSDVRRVDYDLVEESIYGQMIRDFSECLLSGAASPIGFDDGRRSVRLVNAIYEAAAQRRVISVNQEI